MLTIRDKKRFKPMIAGKAIKVYKYFDREGEFLIAHYGEERTRYKVGDTIIVNRFEVTKSKEVELAFVKRGIFSYKNKPLFFDEWKDEMVATTICTIPKGTPYYCEMDAGHLVIVSLKLTIDRILVRANIIDNGKTSVKLI